MIDDVLKEIEMVIGPFDESELADLKLIIARYGLSCILDTSSQKEAIRCCEKNFWETTREKRDELH